MATDTTSTFGLTAPPGPGVTLPWIQSLGGQALTTANNVKLIGEAWKQVTWQPGRKRSWDDIGIVTLEESFKIASAQLDAALANIPKYSPHRLWPGLQLEDIEDENEGDDKWTVVHCKYMGLLAEPWAPKQSVIGNVNQKSLVNHPLFETIIGGTMEAPLNGAIFDDDDNFSGFPSDALNADLAGESSYLARGAIVRRRYASLTDVANIHDLGRIYMPKGAPALAGNFLKTDKRSDRFGGAFAVSEDYMASGQRPWPGVVYLLQ